MKVFDLAQQVIVARLSSIEEKHAPPLCRGSHHSNSNAPSRRSRRATGHLKDFKEKFDGRINSEGSQDRLGIRDTIQGWIAQFSYFERAQR
jgi:hypothetical protein